jgi:hypothetical protein
MVLCEYNPRCRRSIVLTDNHARLLQHCGFGPNSVVHDVVCPNCKTRKSEAAHQRSNQYFCSVPICDHHHQGFSTKWRVIDHERQEHGHLWCQTGECAKDYDSPLMSSEDLLQHWQNKHHLSIPPSPTFLSHTSTASSATLHEHDESVDRPPYGPSIRPLPLRLRLCIILVSIEFAVVFISLIIGTAWTLETEPHDVQGGFTMGAWFLAAGTILVAGVRHIHSKQCHCLIDLHRNIYTQ